MRRELAQGKRLSRPLPIDVLAARSPAGGAATAAVA